MNKHNLINDKFATPVLPDIRTPRHALINRFHKAVRRRIIYVSAPAGYGKTVSTQLWLKNSSYVPLWISLDEYDNTPSIFYKLFCIGILSLQPENKTMTDILTSTAFASSPVEHTIRLLSEFIPDNRQYAIVLDDMHLITSKEMRKSGLLVQKRLPSSFIVVVLTRNKIAKEYISITGKEKCTVITPRNLAFSAEEIQRHFEAHGRFINAEEAAAAYTITNGWAIGVNALAMSGQIVQNGDHILSNYIKTQIWDTWDDDLKDFMLKTSVVDEMSPEFCEKLTGRRNARMILDDLYAKNAFISKFSDDTYQYHHLFLDFLRNTLDQGDETENKMLYKEASDYYLKKQEYFLARRFAFKSGNSETIINANYAFYNTGKSHPVDQSVNFYRNISKEQIPLSVFEQHPYIYCQFAWYYFLIGNASQFECYIDKLFAHFPDIIQNYPQFIENVILITVLDHRISFTRQIERFHSLSPVSDFNCQIQATTLSMQLPYAHRTLRDYSELVDPKVMENLSGTFGHMLKTQRDIVMLELHSGLLYEQNKLNGALKIALQTRDTVDDQTIDEVVFCSFIHLASIYFAMGKENLFADVLNQTEQYIEKSGSYHFSPNFAAFKTKLLLMDGDKAAAKAWLDNYFVTETEQLELYKIFQHFITARAYMVLSQTDTAMSYILKLKKLGADFNRPLDTAEASILQTILEWALGKKKEALETLETALTAMQEYGFVRIAADEGADLLPILKKLALKLKKNSYQGSLDSHFLNEVIIAAYEQFRRYKGISANIRAQKPVKLSRQQKNMITFLSKGYNNAEIVELTGLTIHTIKSHEAAAYAKLGVNNAMDAVLKARELEMIE